VMGSASTPTTIPVWMVTVGAFTPQ